MILISSIIYLFLFLVFILLIRFGNMLVIILEIISLVFLFIYMLKKYSKKYISIKTILYIVLLSVIEFLLFLLLDKYHLIVYSSTYSGALNSILTIIYFFVIYVVFIIVLLNTNLVKYLFKKMESE